MLIGTFWDLFLYTCTMLNVKCEILKINLDSHYADIRRYYPEEADVDPMQIHRAARYQAE